jgi:hypothetical protein
VTSGSDLGAARGLDLSRAYFTDVALPELRRDFPELLPRLAAGLVGNGSECFGYDDEISRDHDWGVDFFIWLTDADAAYMDPLRDWKMNLFDKAPPSHPRTRSEYGARVGVMTCGEFYRSLIGFPRCPETISQWRTAPEEHFAMAVNGAVFIDGAGEFTATRESLLGYYPEDLRLKKVAAKCMSLAQTGQYNLDRCCRRRDFVAMHAVVSRFMDSCIAMVFLLNRSYRPYYKWAFRAMTALPALGAPAGRLLEEIALAGIADDGAIETVIRAAGELCRMFVGELRRQGVSSSDDWFLTTHGEEARRRISDEYLRSLPTQYE